MPWTKAASALEGLIGEVNLTLGYFHNPMKSSDIYDENIVMAKQNFDKSLTESCSSFCSY